MRRHVAASAALLVLATCGMPAAAHAASLTTITLHVCLPPSATGDDVPTGSPLGPGSATGTQVTLNSSTYNVTVPLSGQGSPPRDASGCWNDSVQYPAGPATFGFTRTAPPPASDAGVCFPKQWMLSTPVTIGDSDTLSMVVPDPVTPAVRVLSPQGALVVGAAAQFDLNATASSLSGTVPITTSGGTVNALLGMQEYSYFDHVNNPPSCDSGTSVLTLGTPSSTTANAQVSYAMPGGGVQHAPASDDWSDGDFTGTLPYDVPDVSAAPPTPDSSSTTADGVQQSTATVDYGTSVPVSTDVTTPSSSTTTTSPTTTAVAAPRLVRPRAVSGTPVANAGVVLQAPTTTGGWTNVASATTDSQGAATIPTTATTSGLYRVVGSNYTSQYSTITLLVRPATPAKPSVSSASNAVTVSWTAAADGGNPVTNYVVEWRPSGGAWSSATTATTTYNVTGLTNGTSYEFHVAAVTQVGQSPYTAAMTATPTTDTTAPAVSMTAPTALFQVTKSIGVRYAATDTQSGVASYDVRYRTAAWNAGFGSYAYPKTWQATTAVRQALTGTPGHEYCVSVRARDRAGNVSGWSHERCTALPLDDRALAAASSGWKRVSSSSAYLRTLTQSGSHGAKLKLGRAQVHRLALIATRCASCGDIAVYLNGHLWRTVKTASSTTRVAAIIALPVLSGVHVETVLLMNASIRKPVKIDGIAVSRT